MSGFRDRIAGFDAWWSSRTPRERVLLAVLGVLLAGVVLAYGVVMPLAAIRAQAITDIRTSDAYNTRLLASPGAAAAVPAPTGTPLNVISDKAIAQGLIANTEPIPGGVRATLTDGNYDAVLAWIGDLARTTPYRLQRVSIQRRPGPGRVSATLEFLS